MAHLEKACVISGLPSDWADTVVSAMDEGVRRAKDISSQYGNYLALPCLRRYALNDTPQSEFGLMGRLPFLFLLRVQIEWPPIRRMQLTTPLLHRRPMGYQSLIGVRDSVGGPRLVLMLITMRRARYGPVITRPLFLQIIILALSRCGPLARYGPRSATMPPRMRRYPESHNVEILTGRRCQH